MITVYLDTKDSILLLSNDKSLHVLYHIFHQVDSQNEWYADRINKNIIAEKLLTTLPSIDNYISILKQRELLLSLGTRGRYQLNMKILST